MSHEMGSTESRNKQIIQSAFDKWTAGTGGVFDLLAADAQWTIVGNATMSGTYQSKQEFIDKVIAPFTARLAKPLVPRVRALYADGDMVIAFFDASSIALDGKPYQNTYTWYMRMKDGAIVEAVAFFDTIEFNDFWTRVKPRVAASA